MKDIDRVEKIEEQLYEVKLKQDHIHEKTVQHNRHEQEILYLFQDKKRLFNQMFDHWKHGEMRDYLFQTDSAITSAEKEIMYELSDQRDILRRDRNEMEIKENDLRYEKLRAVEKKE